MQLPDIVPWGRSYDEYLAMFNLSSTDLKRHILGCGDGPASFNAAASTKGATVISADPIYAWPAERIRARIDEVRPLIESELRQDPSRCVWKRFRTIDALIATRLNAMQRFLDDYGERRPGKRYVAASLPQLPFPDQTFDLALVSHLLFTYSRHLSARDHKSAIQELMRVSREIRIFPLLTLGGDRSEHLQPVIKLAESQGWQASIMRVDYLFQRGGDQMLRLASEFL